MIRNLVETLAFVVLLICAACGILMALVNIVCNIVRMTPWYIKYREKTSVGAAAQIIQENYIHYVCPDCGNVMLFECYIENYCARCGHKITEEEKKKHETV